MNRSLKSEVAHLVREALEALHVQGAFPELPADTGIERSKDARHGHFACHLPLALARQARVAPRALAERIKALLPPSPLVERVEIAGPGFLNFHLRPSAFQALVGRVLAQGTEYGRGVSGAGQRIQVEYVSANPTGPLHIGHGRGAAYGSALAAVLEAAGYEVEREYYVNDAGRQMDILAVSIWLRYLERLHAPAAFPANGYRGQYVHEIAASLQARHGSEFDLPASRTLPAFGGEDGEAEIDALIVFARECLDEWRYRELLAHGCECILENIRDDLAEFGVAFERWFSERALIERGAVERAIERLREQGCIYARDGAQWFRSTDFGDEKDRVVVRENGQKTYFASDIAYHLEKFERGFDQVINVWGADHHGYVARLKAALSALGCEAGRLQIMLVQFATLFRGSERVQMSTRSGEFVTLAELRREVGRDAARFFYLLRKSDQHLDFDLELATSRSSDNPVYYVQYAHARICSVFRQLGEAGGQWDRERGLGALDRLDAEAETLLLQDIARYPEVLETAARSLEPHLVGHFLRDLAHHFHVYYTQHKFLVDDLDLRAARLCLVAALRQVLQNGLELLGVGAPESM